MVYYGHALQFPELLPCNVNPSSMTVVTFPFSTGTTSISSRSEKRIRRGSSWVVHCHHGSMMRASPSVPTIHREFPRAATSESYSEFTIDFDQVDANQILGTQPEARKWVLARQEILMGDDDQQLPGTRNKRIYLNRGFGAMSLFPVDPRWEASFSNIGFNTIGLLESGRVDLAGMGCPVSARRCPSRGIPRIPTGSCPPFDLGTASTSTRSSIGMSSIRMPSRRFRVSPAKEAPSRELIKSLVRWPRAERVPPGQDAFDQHLSIPSSARPAVHSWSNGPGTRTWARSIPSRR